MILPTTPPPHEPQRWNPRWALAAGLLLLAGYFAIAAALDNFADPFLDYKVEQNRVPFGKWVEWAVVKDFAKPTLLSMLWKLALLFPATLCLALFAAARSAPAQAELWGCFFARLKPAPTLAVIVIGLIALQLFWSQAIYQNQPLFDDEETYAFHAKLLRAGHLFGAPAPPGAPCFANHGMIIRDGRWTTNITPGFPLVLFLSSFLGSTRALPILLGALTPLLVFLIGRRQYGARVGLLAAALFVVSPMYLFSCATLMNHGATLFLMALFMLAYLETKPGRSWVFPIVAGLALGWGFNARPQTAIAFGAPFAVWSAIKLVSRQRGREAPGQLLMLASFAAPFAFALYYNKVVTGSALTFPFQLYSELQGGGYNMGFGPAGEGESAFAHTPLNALANLLLNALRMSLWLFGWPCSLVFVLLFALRGRFERADRIHLGIIASTCAFYAAFLSPGVLEIGPRFYFELLIPLSLFTARGALAAHELLKRTLVPPDAAAGASVFQPQALVPSFIGLSILFAGLTFYGEQGVHYLSLTDAIAAPYRAVEAKGIHNAIVRIESLPPAGWIYNPRNNRPDLSDDVVYVRATKEASALLAVMNALPNRSVYNLKCDETTGGRIVIAPIAREIVEQAVTEQARSAGAPPSAKTVAPTDSGA